MKTHARINRQGNGLFATVGRALCLVGALWLAGWTSAVAEGTNSPMTPAQMFEGGTNTYNNWVTLSAGGLVTRGSQAEAQQNLHLDSGAFGGIEDLHVQGKLGKNSTFTVDGHSIFDNHDYQLGLKFQREDLGFVRFDFENFRTWYNGAGGYYPPTGTQYELPNDVLALDRGEITFQAGLTKPGIPKITFTYNHRYRDGQKSTTIWGPAHPDPANFPALVRGVSPGINDIDETVDTFSLDVTHHIKATDFGGGLRYETADLNDSRKTTFWPGEPVQQKVTNREGTTYGQFSVHAFSETWLRDNLFFSSGLLYSHLDSDLSGSRIYGNDFDVGYAPGTLNGLGYYDLDGFLRQEDYVMNLNLMAVPLSQFTIIPSIRVQKEDWNADSSGIGTLGTGTEPFSARSDRSTVDVTEALHLRYTGVTNWLFYGRGEWTEGNGSLFETNGLSQVNGFGVPPILRQTDDRRLFQKYSAGARWYPLRHLTVDVGGYYKDNQYNYNHSRDSTPNNAASVNRYPAYLVTQGFETYDGNCRLTVRPLQNLSLVARYEYQLSTVHTAPASVSTLPEVESSKMTTHVVACNLSWTPWSRLYLQPGFNYVLSETRTPASAAALNGVVPAGYTRAILDSQNNYWTVDFASGLVLDDKTDLNVSYFYYQSDNYVNDAAVALPLGVGAHEHGVAATLTRRLTPRLRWNLRYGFYKYDDATSGGFNNYEAHVVFSSLQYRF